MALLSRVAGRIYWAARYIERAEDTARLVRAFGDVLADLPESAGTGGMMSWDPLMAVFGGEERQSQAGSALDAERRVVHALVADTARPGSIVSAVGAARENLRTTREVLPREAWQALNDLHLFVEHGARRAVERRFREGVLGRVVDDSRRLDGILISTMTRDAAYDMWRLGRYIERADMTTRVVGVRAQALLTRARTSGPSYDEVHWMGVLRSLSALQMYQRATRGPIEGSSVVRFLLFDSAFPRSVAGCLDEMEHSVERLSRRDGVIDAIRQARSTLVGSAPAADDGADLDRATERIQAALAELNDAIAERYLSVGG